MAVRAVLFDLGDTLIFRAHEPDERKLYAAMAGRVRPLLRAWGAPSRFGAIALLRELFRAVEVAQPGRRARGYEVDGPFIARGALASYGLEISAKQAETFWRATAVGLEPWGAQTYPDTIDTLRRLRSLAIPVALVSNTWSKSDMVRSDLADAAITEELLSVIVTSADVMRPKPHPAPFRRALAALNVEPTETVFIGDDLEADIQGAKALGMATVWKLNGRHEVPTEPDADYVVHDLCELFTLGLLPEAADAPLRQESLTPHEDDNAGRY